jgi:hypothetical protein
MTLDVSMPRLGKIHGIERVKQELLSAVQITPEWHNHGEKVEREFEERILEWNKGPKTKARWEELEFKLVGRKCNGRLIQVSEPVVQVELLPDQIAYKVVSSCSFRCMAAVNYQLDPNVIQYSAMEITQLELDRY